MSNNPSPVPTVGFVSPPGWFDPAPGEFPALVEDGAVRTQQCILPLVAFDYALSSVANAGQTLALAARLLGGAGCDLIAQVGSPFTWAEVESEDQARLRASRLSADGGVPTVWTGLAIVDGLRALGAKKLAVTTSYYGHTWRQAFATFLGHCGFEVPDCQSFVTQGLYPDQGAVDADAWDYSREQSTTSMKKALEAVPDADAVVVTGAGIRTLALLPEIEEDLGKPVVSADVALYWAVMKELALKPVHPAGSLLATL